MNTLGVKTAELRSFLFDSMKKAQAGELPSHDGRNIVGMANQINLNIQAEIKRANQAVELGQKADAFGKLQIG